MKSSVIKVGGMSCQGCVKNVTGVLQALPGVRHAEVLLDEGEARVSYDSALVSIDRLCTAIEDAGFDASVGA